MTLMLIQRRRKGFTIVELMVVMIGIGLLLTVSVFAYGAWRTSVAKTEVMNDLKNVAAAMKNARNFDNVYPTLTPGSTFDENGPEANQKLFVSSPGVIVTYYSGDSSNYCMDASSKTKPEVHYFIDTISGMDPVFGTCANGVEDPNNPSSGGPTDNVAFYSSKLSASGNVTCALASDNKAYCWGENGSGQTGVGNTTTPVKAPTQVVQGARPDMTAKSVAAGYQHSCVVASNDGAYCFGYRLQAGVSTGALGDKNSSPVPQNIPSPTAVTNTGALSGGQAKQLSTEGGIYTCAIGMNGQMYCWGLANNNWQLGSTAGQTYPPIAVVDTNSVFTGKTAKQIRSATWHSCVIASDDWIYCWGNNHRTGTTSNPGLGTPVYIAPVVKDNIPPGTRFVQMDAVGTRTCAVTAQNRLYCWGQISYNDLQTHLGNILSGTSGGFDVPTAVNLAELPDNGRIKQVALGDEHICVISTNGKVYCAGRRGSSGALGDGLTGTETTTAVQVSQGEMPSDATAKYIEAGDDHTCIIASNSKVYCWGSNVAGQLGNNTTTNSAVPVEVKNIPNIASS